MSVLRVHRLVKSFDGVKAVDDLSFELEEHKITALVGPNGSGKTTVFNVISGLLSPNSGDIYLGETRITGWHPHRRARAGIGRTFQIIRLCPQMTVIENVMLALRFPKGERLVPSLLQRRRVMQEDEQNRAKALEHLELVGMAHKKDALGQELSHGQRRLAEIARALALNPRLLLLDEPMSGLSPSAIDSVKQIMKKLRDQGKTILFIDHNMKVVSDVSEHVIVLNYGEKIAEGTVREIQMNEEVLTAYLGRSRALAP